MQSVGSMCFSGAHLTMQRFRLEVSAFNGEQDKIVKASIQFEQNKL